WTRRAQKGQRPHSGTRRQTDSTHLPTRPGRAPAGRRSLRGRPAMKQSPSSESSLAVVQAMYAAFSAGDELRLRELIASDVAWQQCEGFPGGEHRSGIESVLAGVLRGNQATWQGFAVAIDEYVCDHDIVVAIGSYSGTHSLTGKSMRSV